MRWPTVRLACAAYNTQACGHKAESVWTKDSSLAVSAAAWPKPTTSSLCTTTTSPRRMVGETVYPRWAQDSSDTRSAWCWAGTVPPTQLVSGNLKLACVRTAGATLDSQMKTWAMSRVNCASASTPALIAHGGTAPAKGAKFSLAYSAQAPVLPPVWPTVEPRRSPLQGRNGTHPRAQVPPHCHWARRMPQPCAVPPRPHNP